MEVQATQAQKIKERKHKYYLEHREEILEKWKKYSEENAEKIREKNRLLYHKNIEREKARKQELIRCECGKIYSRNHASEHKKTKYHLANV